MSYDSDPYYMFLGIPRKERPIDHYRLLGLDRFEANDEIIAMAADRQMGHLQRYESGEDADHVAELMSEVSRARICLLDPAKRTAYNEKLREQLRSISSIDSDNSPTSSQSAARSEQTQISGFELPDLSSESPNHKSARVAPDATTRSVSSVVQQTGETEQTSFPIVEPAFDEKQRDSYNSALIHEKYESEVSIANSSGHSPRTNPATHVYTETAAVPAKEEQSSPTRTSQIWLYAVVGAVVIGVIIGILSANSGDETREPSKPDKRPSPFTGTLDTEVEAPQEQLGVPSSV